MRVAGDPVRGEPVESDRRPRKEDARERHEHGRTERSIPSRAEQPEEKRPDEELRRNRQPESGAAPKRLVAPAPSKGDERHEQQRRVSGDEITEDGRRDERQRVAPHIAHVECPQGQRHPGAEHRQPERQAQPPRQERERRHEKHLERRIERRVSHLHGGLNGRRVWGLAIEEQRARIPERALEVEPNGVVGDPGSKADVRPDDGRQSKHQAGEVQTRSGEPDSGHS